MLGHCVLLAFLLTPSLRIGCSRCACSSRVVCVPHSSDLSVLVAGHIVEVDTSRVLEVRTLHIGLSSQPFK